MILVCLEDSCQKDITDSSLNKSQNHKNSTFIPEPDFGAHISQFLAENQHIS